MNEVEYLDKSLSKRAARRIIQRAFVLMGREKPARQHIRESQLTTLWIIEDWDLAWTVYLNRGRFEVERRPAKRPDVTLTWPTAEGFFAEVEGTGDGTQRVQMIPTSGQQRFFEPLLRGFFASLRHVLANPVDDVGDPLV
jgi:hypothetical protein